VTHDDFDGIDIRRELRASRPNPPGEFTSMLADRVRGEQPRRRVAPRIALTLTTTVAALAVAAAFGGISQAAYGVEGAVSSIVHVGQKAKPHQAVTKSKPVAPQTSHSRFGGGASHGATHQPPPQVQPPQSPSQDQYNPGCTPGVRGPYIKCNAP
jgi:hypothetical protein